MCYSYLPFFEKVFEVADSSENHETAHLGSLKQLKVSQLRLYVIPKPMEQSINFWSGSERCSVKIFRVSKLISGISRSGTVLFVEYRRDPSILGSLLFMTHKTI